ncbi:AAA family ATPase [Candidatus Woesearchaeota archaeon]|nr:AAA family ATPase [Candidatus Woesearchaeota archaeon]
MIIGLTSLNGAGKTTAAEYLVQKGFIFYSLSDVIREEIKGRNLEITRDRLRETGNELRAKFGNSVLADRVMEKLEEGKNYVIDSIRHPAEIESLKKRKDFSMIFIDASIETRFERVIERQRESDPMTLKDFKKEEELELKGKDSANQQLLECKELADFVIENETSIDELYRKIDSLLVGLIE